MSRFHCRRRLLKGAAALGGCLAFPAIVSGAARVRDRRSGPDVVFAVNADLTGPFAAEGAEQVNAARLAVEHLNGAGDGGMLGTFSSQALSGAGVNGRRVALVIADAQTKADRAGDNARRMIARDGAVMVTGGSTSGVAIAAQAACREMGAVFMAAASHANDTTGRERSPNGFRHCLNAQISGAAMRPVLEAALGRDRAVFHLTADYLWGRSQERAMTAHVTGLGWKVVGAARVPLGAADVSHYLVAALGSGADTLIVNQYGPDFSNTLRQLGRLGLRERVAGGAPMAVIAPVYSRLMVEGAGDSIAGVLGAASWHWSLQDAGSRAFTRSFSARYGAPPGEAAHTVYCQTLLYADAAQRAGSFAPRAIADALSDFAFDGLGNGPAFYRGADHQCFKTALVMRGKANPEGPHDLLEIVGATPAEALIYPPDHPDFVAA